MWENHKDYCMNCDGDKKLAFIHIPRTAGKSIRKAFNLGFHGKKFNRVKTYSCAHRRAINVWPEKVVNEFDTFSVIRDPWSRLVSLYHYYAGRPDMKKTYKFFKKYKNFSDFVFDLDNITISNSRNYESIYELPDNFKSCSYFICDDNNQILVKNLIRFEYLNDDLKLFAKKVNINMEFPLFKVKKKQGLKHKNYKEYYNDKLIQKVADKYINDINIFGFEYK